MPITILIVDDEEIVHKLIRVALMGFGDIVFLVAKNGAEGLKIAREHYGHIDLLISDVVMPGRMNGAEMAVQPREQRSDRLVHPIPLARQPGRVHRPAMAEPC